MAWTLLLLRKSQNFYEKELGYKIPLAPPFVGRDFNVTRAGIHADGVAKDEEIYNIFNTAKLLNRPLSVGSTKLRSCRCCILAEPDIASGGAKAKSARMTLALLSSRNG